MKRRGRLMPKRRSRLAGRRGFLLALIFAAIAVARWSLHEPEPPSPESLAEGVCEVQRVVDGDTLLLANGARVRLIGVDTPETVKSSQPVQPWGPEAAEFTRQFVAGGTVRLQFDRERIDRYGRFLAYVWVNDRLLNEELVRAGLARMEPQYRYARAMKERLRRAEQEAKDAGRGIWSQ